MPRRYHAEAIERLLAAGAARIAYDVDFSTPSQPGDDRMLAEALAQVAEHGQDDALGTSMRQGLGKHPVVAWL